MNTAVMSPTAETTRETEASKRKLLKNDGNLEERGLEAAARFLVRRGYDVIERDWECSAGKIDIIARDEDTLIFVEVKTRKDNEQGFPTEKASEKKRTKYEKIALAFLHDFEEVDLMVRFDMISIVVVSPDRALIRHHQNALGVC